MKVLLISANTEQINMPVLPLGLACVASAVQAAGHAVRFLNFMSPENLSQELATAIADFKPQVIGISVRNIDDQDRDDPRFMVAPVQSVVARCRALSDAWIVLGGAGYSIFPRSVLAYLGADMGIAGEGEDAFVRLLEALAQNRPLTHIPGLCLPDGNGPAPAEHPRTLDRFPPPQPENHLIVPSRFKGEDIWVPFQTRRGCPMNCAYCSTPTIEGRILRKLSVSEAIHRLQRFVRAGFRRFFFVDNTFNLPPSYAKSVCRAIIDAGLDIRWRCIFYPHHADEKLLALMYQAGCRELSLGFESGSRPVLKQLNKRFGPADVQEVAARLGAYGIHRMGFLMFGGPGETRQTVMESLDFAEALALEAMHLTIGVRIYPHTALARLAASEGKFPSASESELFRPSFYLADHLDGWLQETVKKRAAGRESWWF